MSPRAIVVSKIQQISGRSVDWNQNGGGYVATRRLEAEVDIGNKRNNSQSQSQSLKTNDIPTHFSSLSFNILLFPCHALTHTLHGFLSTTEK
jgi:hypothetical protein